MDRDAVTETDGAPAQTTAVLVEFPTAAGLQQVALTPAQLAERSAEAIDAAFGVVQEMAGKFATAVASIDVKPRELEMEFGVKLTAEAGAFIAKAGGEGSIVVRLRWSGS